MYPQPLNILSATESKSDELQAAIKIRENELNVVKEMLNRPDFLKLKRSDSWENGIRFQRNRITNNYGGQNVTKAWLKMYEILIKTMVGPYLLQLGNNINCFFNAELPGGFIFAVNHFLRTNNKSFDWVIASYLPMTGTGFLEDDFHLLSEHPDHALVGRILTNQGAFWSNGDLTNPKIPAILATLATSRLSPIHLYTADGGFDVQGRESQQEILSLPLIRGEVECGLRALSIRGVMIIKIFTFFTPQMWTMLVFLTRLFDNYDIYKPQTSGPLNSESYFIGIGYHGLNDNDLSIIFQDPSNPLTRYAVATPFENNFLSNKMNSLTSNQITNIYDFLENKSPKLEINIYQYVQKLPLDERL